MASSVSRSWPDLPKLTPITRRPLSLSKEREMVLPDQPNPHQQYQRQAREQALREILAASRIVTDGLLLTDTDWQEAVQDFYQDLVDRSAVNRGEAWSRR